MRGRGEVKRFRMEAGLNKFSDEQFASQILLVAEQKEQNRSIPSETPKFCSRPQRKTLRNRGKNERKQNYRYETD